MLQRSHGHAYVCSLGRQRGQRGFSQFQILASEILSIASHGVEKVPRMQKISDFPKILYTQSHVKGGMNSINGKILLTRERVPKYGGDLV